MGINLTLKTYDFLSWSLWSFRMYLGAWAEAEFGPSGTSAEESVDKEVESSDVFE